MHANEWSGHFINQSFVRYCHGNQFWAKLAKFVYLAFIHCTGNVWVDIWWELVQTPEFMRLQSVQQVTISTWVSLAMFTMAWHWWAGTTRVSWYQKKHSPTHTYPDHQPSFISFLHRLHSIASSLFNKMLDSLFAQPLSKSSLLYLLLLNPALHTPYISSPNHWTQCGTLVHTNFYLKTFTVTINCSYNCFCICWY